MFQTGDFVAWLRQFECSANANTWDAAAKFRKLPAFLRGPAASYFHSLEDAQKVHMHISFLFQTFGCFFHLQLNAYCCFSAIT